MNVRMAQATITGMLLMARNDIRSLSDFCGMRSIHHVCVRACV